MNYGLTLNLVNGKLIAAKSGATIPVINPADDSEVGQVPAMSAEDIQEVFAAAKAGATVWRNTGLIERGAILAEAARLIRESKAELVDIIVTEMGKTIKEATGEVGKAAEFFEWYASFGRNSFGSLLPDARVDTFAGQINEPLGVVLLITPWNDPLLTPARKLAPALIAGNSVVIKPASETPIITLKLAEIFNKAGLPAGVLNTVTGRGSEIGDLLVQNKNVEAISFTGSTSVGLQLQRTLAGSGVRIQTEMGGKNAAVVLNDADQAIALAAIAGAGFGQAGQRCTATSRLILQREIATEFLAKLEKAVSALKVSAGNIDGADLGPVVSRNAQKTINEAVSNSLAQGATVIGQTAIDGSLAATGAFVAPILLQVETSNSIWKEEVFGPVIAAIVVDTMEEAIAAVNDSDYGLSSAIFTQNLTNAYRFVREANTGQVSVNQPTSGWDLHQPFGGFKDSGSPFKEQGLPALNFYSKIKTFAIRAS